MELQPHPEMRHHAEHLDFMLYHTQQDLDNARMYANQTHLALATHADAIKHLARERKKLRLQHAKKDATIARLRAQIASLEATMAPPNRNNKYAMMHLLQTLLADRETERAEREKDELNRQHQDELNALKTSYQDLKSQLIQLGLDHAKALKAAEVSAAAKLDEALEDASNATVVLRAELEEMAKARKGAEEKAARLEEERKECDQLILQTDTLALRLFPDSQRYAVKKVDAQRKDKGQADLTVPWTPKDHLVALNARVSHMRCIDRNLSDIPDVATQLYRTLWPGEEVPDTFSLINDRLKGAGRRIREWQCSAARAGADSALRVACSWYPELNLDALTGVREGAETDLDPILSAKRQDRAYCIAESGT
ncbi:uncharacterized protein [Lolium perenne]|uniref:uncharacterized protein n=1 Tax=Lolium perenne TaxID=4522 RepID=UPI003A99A747